MELLNKILKKPEFKKKDKFCNFSLKTYEDSDFESLLSLYNKVFPNFMTEELWDWKNKKNPFGNFYTILMEHNDKIIAAYIVSPKEFFLYGKKYPCVQSMDTMTEKNYCGIILKSTSDRRIQLIVSKR